MCFYSELYLLGLVWQIGDTWNNFYYVSLIDQHFPLTLPPIILCSSLQHVVWLASKLNEGWSVPHQELIPTIPTVTVNIDFQLDTLYIRFCCHLVFKIPYSLIYSSVPLSLKWTLLRRVNCKKPSTGDKAEMLETEIKSHFPLLYRCPNHSITT